MAMPNQRTDREYAKFREISGETVVAVTDTQISDVNDNLDSIINNTGGLSRANAPARIDYTTVNGGAGVSTSAYTQIVASLASATKELYIFDSSGRALFLATGAASSEVDQIYIEPGGTGNGPVRLAIAAGTRISVKAVDAAATKGQLLISFLG